MLKIRGLHRDTGKSIDEKLFSLNEIMFLINKLNFSPKFVILLRKKSQNMKITVFLSFLFFISLSISAQNELKKSVGISSKATAPANAQALTPSNESVKSTICFNEPDVAENIVKTRTSFYCSAFPFSSVSEAESFAASFRNSDSNVTEFTFVGVKNSVYYFNFTTKEPKDIKWYLNLFKRNNFEFIKYNNETQSIDKALAN